MPTVAGCLNNRKSKEEGWKRICPWSVGDAGIKEGQVTAGGLLYIWGCDGGNGIGGEVKICW